MRRVGLFALGAGLLVAIGCGPSAAETARLTSRCPSGSLHTIYKGTHTCLRLAARKRIHDGLAQARDRGTSGQRAYDVTAARFRVGVGAVKTIAREGARKAWRLPAAPRLPDGIPVLPGGGGRAASLVFSQPDCADGEPGRGVVRLSWGAALERGAEQRVIVTIFRDGFERPAFEASGALAPARTSFDWYRPHGQAIHFWRVLTRHADGWAPSAIGRFEGPTCPVDAP